MTVKTYEEIIKQAKACKSNVKNDYKIGITPKWGYYFARALVNPKKDIPTITIDSAPKPSYTNISRQVSSKQYLELAKKYYKFIEDIKNKESKYRLPNYLRFGNYKISIQLATYTFARCLIYYETYGKYDPEITINQKVFNKPSLKPYLTDEGCSGMGQCTKYWCGPNSLQQCFYRLTGIHVKESTIAAVAGSTTDGTDHQGLNTAVAWFNKKYDKNIKIVWYNFSDLGKNDSERWSKLSSLIKKGAVFCHLLYRDQWGHYEVPKSVGDNNLSILNSLGDSCGSGTYCGYIEPRTKATQKRYIGGISQKSIAVLTNG